MPEAGVAIRERIGQPIPFSPDLGMAGSELDRRSLNSRGEVRILASWEQAPIRRQLRAMMARWQRL
jgi:hypothetical protein